MFENFDALKTALKPKTPEMIEKLERMSAREKRSVLSFANAFVELGLSVDSRYSHLFCHCDASELQNIHILLSRLDKLKFNTKKVMAEILFITKDGCVVSDLRESIYILQENSLLTGDTLDGVLHAEDYKQYVSALTDLVSLFGLSLPKALALYESLKDAPGLMDALKVIKHGISETPTVTQLEAMVEVFGSALLRSRFARRNTAYGWYSGDRDDPIEQEDIASLVCDAALEEEALEDRQEAIFDILGEHCETNPSILRGLVDVPAMLPQLVMRNTEQYFETFKEALSDCDNAKVLQLLMAKRDALEKEGLEYAWEEIKASTALEVEELDEWNVSEYRRLFDSIEPLKPRDYEVNLSEIDAALRKSPIFKARMKHTLSNITGHRFHARFRPSVERTSSDVSRVEGHTEVSEPGLISGALSGT